MVPLRRVKEKKRAHYDLDELRQLVRDGNWHPTRRAEFSAIKLGFSRTEVKEIILALRHGDFVKSMTSFHSYKLWQDVYKLWQDVYRPCVLGSDEEKIELYVKLQKSTDARCVVVSFKRWLEEE